MNSSYFEQFNTINLIYFNISESIISISNFSLVLLFILIITLNLHNSNNISSCRSLLIWNIIYFAANNITNEHLNPNNNTYLPLILSLLSLLLTINLIGLLPYTFTPTAHIIITISLSLTIITSSTTNSIVVHNSSFLSVLTPQSAPLILTPFLVLIETASYFTRALSLGVRLSANISAGHLLLAILSSFTFNLLFSISFILSLIPITILSLISLLEIAVAIIQAYVFTLLTAIYLSDTINLH